jgi:hypothetical protein
MNVAWCQARRGIGVFVLVGNPPLTLIPHGWEPPHEPKHCDGVLLVGGGGFEPPKVSQLIYSQSHLAALVTAQTRTIIARGGRRCQGLMQGRASAGPDGL